MYQCWQCGAVEVATYQGASGLSADRARFAADRALWQSYAWTKARPDPNCPKCGDKRDG